MFVSLVNTLRFTCSLWCCSKSKLNPLVDSLQIGAMVLVMERIVEGWAHFMILMAYSERDLEFIQGTR